VVNILTGDLSELLGAANLHDDLDALYLGEGAVDAALVKSTGEEGARVMRRILTVPGATEPASPHQLAKLAEAAQKLERGAGREFLSTRAGQLKYADEALPGNQLAGVIIDAVREHAYYPGAFDPDNKTPPTCYAFGRDDESEMFPHVESMAKSPDFFMPQHFDAAGNVAGCNGCPMNVFGTADKGGGKACKSKMRLSILPAGIYEPVGRTDWQLNLFDEPDHYKTATPAYLSVPVTSGKNWSDYTRMLRTKYGRPPLGAFTRIFLTPHEKHQFHVNFELVTPGEAGLVPNELLGIMIERGEAETSEPLRGYEKPAADDGQKRGFTRR
jgi:hypothetical protein